MGKISDAFNEGVNKSLEFLEDPTFDNFRDKAEELKRDLEEKENNEED